MAIRRLIRSLVSAVLVLSFSLSSTLAQGPLGPPGAPAPMFKTLHEVEPRTPVTNLPFTISQPGSYYFTTNLTGVSGDHGIDVQASDVTLDLNGFSLIGATGCWNGIRLLSNQDRLIVRNGTVLNWPRNGIYAGDSSYCLFRDLQIISNGWESAVYDGLVLGDQSSAQDCVAALNSDDGILSKGTEAYVKRCRAIGNRGNGLDVEKSTEVSDNLCAGNAAGICAQSSGNRIENNHVAGNATGLVIDASGNYVAGNIVKDNADNYDIVAGNHLNILLCEVPESIDWPASVKLAGTLVCSSTSTNGIEVNADNVTIDLAGHALVGPGASSKHGINQPDTLHGLRIMNGMLTDWRGSSNYAVYARGHGSLIKDVLVISNYSGIYQGTDGVIVDCAAYNNLGVGIAAVGGTIQRCASTYNGDFGLFAGWGASVVDCVSSHNGMDGIFAFGDNLILNNQCDGNGTDTPDGAGIRVLASGVRVDGNNVTDNGIGIRVDFWDNIIVRNTASNNGTNYVIVASNAVGQIAAAPNSTAISGSSALGATVGTTDPWANISY
ncbi:MAG: right-handed parallel beta-helix repeat-containing protein [Kiritimatiellae bacterium]|nr:right-handed parallel beta-helix repeat-containing protein [Kiritimatiellia bacterium]